MASRDDVGHNGVKLVYVAGPYRARSIDGVFNNIVSARSVAVDLWKHGFAVICPHMNTAMMDGIGDDDMFLSGDLEMLARCDAICMAPGWEYSDGANEERNLAVRLGLKEITLTHEGRGYRCEPCV